MGYVYHGTKIKGLKIIEPRVSTHQQNLVYATESPCVATIFLNDGGNDLLYVLGGRGTKENPAYLVERLPETFEKLFSENGSIYTLDDTQFSHREGFWNAEVVAEGPQQVLNEKIINNILDKLKEYQDYGTLNIYRYPNRPDFVPLDNSDLIDKYIKFYNMGHSRSIDQLLSLYPEFFDEVNKRLKDSIEKKL